MHKLPILLLPLIIILCISENALGQESSYTQALNKIEQKRIDLYKQYLSAGNHSRDSLRTIAKKYVFEKLVKDIFPAWYGTQWDFNGITRTPKKGKIACGYFVTTTLKQVGFNIPRYKWAQLSAENIIKQFTNNKKIKRMSNAPVKEVETYIKNSGNGLYVVGLDCHVGFICNIDDSISFVHSSYYEPEIGVMSQALDTSNPLRDSNYRVIGKLLDDTMIESWILGKKFQGYYILKS